MTESIPWGAFIKKARKKNATRAELLWTNRNGASGLTWVRTVADERTSMLMLVFRSLLPSRLPPVSTLKTRSITPEHILPELNEKGQQPPSAGYGIVIKGIDKVIILVDFQPSPKTMYWKLAIPTPRLLGSRLCARSKGKFWLIWLLKNWGFGKQNCPALRQYSKSTLSV